MPRRPVLRRTSGVLAAAALIATAAAATSVRGAPRGAARGRGAGRFAHRAGDAGRADAQRAAEGCAHGRRGEQARLRDPLEHLRQQVPARRAGDVPRPAPGPDPELPDDVGVLRRRLRARQGREPRGPRQARQRVRRRLGLPRPGGGVPGTARAARPLGPARVREPVRARGDPALAAGHGRERPHLGARPCARASERRRRAGRRVDGAPARSGGARHRRQDRFRALRRRRPVAARAARST